MENETAIKLHYYSVKCLSCDFSLPTLTTQPEVTVEICSKCHVFFTKGSYKDKKLGRIDRFYRKYKER